MNITGVMSVINAVEDTANTRYRIEFRVKDGELSQLTSNIFSIKEDGNDEFICSIYYENKMINYSWPDNINGKIFIDDFETILANAKEYIAKKHNQEIQ